jgi:hypothetical protein
MSIRDFLEEKGVEVQHQISILEINEYMKIGKEPCIGGLYRTLFAKSKDMESLTNKDWLELSKIEEVA